MRPLCDALGIQIEWDSTSSTAYCSKGDTTFSLTVGSKSAQLNGSPIALERAPKLVNNKRRDNAYIRVLSFFYYISIISFKYQDSMSM
jgi:hypothetical protein